MYINQGTVDAKGRFSIPVPSGTEDKIIKCSLRGELTDAGCFYTSNNGEINGAGTKSSPLSFQKALELARDGGRIFVMDEILLPEDFVWPNEQKHITVSGVSDDAALNICYLPNVLLNIYTDATFENLQFVGSNNGEDRKGSIRANGKHVILEETVTTKGTLASFRGGVSETADCDLVDVEIYGGNFYQIYGGGGHIKGDCKLTVGGNANSLCVPQKGHGNSVWYNIYGGSWDNVIEGNCITTIKGNAKAGYVYGGCLEYEDETWGDQRPSGVKGEIVMNIALDEGGEIMNVYGIRSHHSSIDREKITINMLSGKVESIIGSTADFKEMAMKADITVNAVGGTITRRIIGGVYVDLDSNNPRKSVDGTTTVIIHPGIDGSLKDTQIGNGIIAGSRNENNPQNETATLIFLGDTYEKYKKKITWNNGGRYSGGDGADWCDSNYDYIVTGTIGGMITSKSNHTVTILPDENYEAKIDGNIVSGDYILTKTKTDVVFTLKENTPYALTDMTAAAVADGVCAAVTYTAESESNTLMLILLEDNKLVGMKCISAQGGNHRTDDIIIPYSVNAEKDYTVKALLWNSLDNMIPLCNALSINVTEE